MSIDYLDIQIPGEKISHTDLTADALFFSGRTTGCSCCSDSFDFSETSKVQALELADQWIKELRARLKQACEVKRKIRAVKVADWDKARST